MDKDNEKLLDAVKAFYGVDAVDIIIDLLPQDKKDLILGDLYIKYHEDLKDYNDWLES